MAEERSLGLSELIEHVKSELLSEKTDAKSAPLFSVDQVDLQLQVTVSTQGNAGINISVVQLGGSAGRNDVQTVRVTLTPLLSKEERIAALKKRYPDLWQQAEEKSLGAFTREETL